MFTSKVYDEQYRISPASENKIRSRHTPSRTLIEWSRISELNEATRRTAAWSCVWLLRSRRRDSSSSNERVPSSSSNGPHILVTHDFSHETHGTSHTAARMRIRVSFWTGEYCGNHTETTKSYVSPFFVRQYSVVWFGWTAWWYEEESLSFTVTFFREKYVLSRDALLIFMTFDGWMHGLEPLNVSQQSMDAWPSDAEDEFARRTNIFFCPAHERSSKKRIYEVMKVHRQSI
jgi:hypothetical protein